MKRYDPGPAKARAMRRLILYRHAKTEAYAPGRKDCDRTLTSRGVTDAGRVAVRLAELGFAPDLALVSPALRARQTWQCAEAVFPQTRVDISPSLYNAAAEDVTAVLAAAPAVTIMVVGHNPSLQELAYSLLDEGAGTPDQIEAVSAGFPTATAAVFHFADNGKAELEALIHARDLRPLAD